MKLFTEIILGLFLFLSTVFMCVLFIDTASEQEQQAEKEQLEIQHLKYQVGIDSLRYDLELNFYERRKAE